MKDTTALLIVAIACIVIFLARLLCHGNYQEQFILTPGNYLIGFDIPSGKGDLLAESGDGNFIIRNKATKNWSIGNPIGKSHALQASRFRNIPLNRGDILEINGNVTILVTPPAPIQDPSTEPLGPGIYRFGVDVPPGKYDLEIVSGDGDVLLVEVGKDSYTFFQDMSSSNPVKADTFANVTCTRAHELWVNDTLEVKLKRSKRQPLILKKLI